MFFLKMKRLASIPRRAIFYFISKETFLFVISPPLILLKMMNKILFILALVAFAAGSLSAGNVNQQKAQQVGEKFLSTSILGQERAGFSLQLVTAAMSRDGVDYYVFNVQGGHGFVIVAGDDRVRPILAYSTEGSYDPTDVAEGFEFTLSGYRKEIQYIREHDLAATPDITAEWKKVNESGQLNPGRAARAVVGPLCQTNWHQNFPYNSQCPEDATGNGGYVYAGCVATAMGQVMKYYDWPERGMGSHTYNPSGYAQQTANFGDTDYHFELMPLAVDSTSTEEEYYYIAQFLHHCGIAVDMQYSGEGSGAYSFDVPPALRNYFGYTCDDDETLGFWGFNFYTNEQWIQMLKEGGLDEQLPLYYSGADDSGAGGHAFVCDGYDENDYFHFNWGWSGRDDAWCPIGALHTTKYNFNDQNSFIGHIIPADGVYEQRADSVADMQVVECRAYDGVMVSWTNPSYTLGGDDLSTIESITIRRNSEVIATLTDCQPGETMSFEDTDLAPGLYEYAIYVTNAAGISRNTYRTVLVGETCELTFQLHDDGGNGWKGAAISVTDENDQRIAVISMADGSDTTLVVPLLKQNLNFIWNHGWYHTQEQYDTDYECSFVVYDADGNELYASEVLEDGVFLTYDNNCEQSPLTCYPVRDLGGDYQWHNGEEYGAYLTWNAPFNHTWLHHFNVVRSSGDAQDLEVIAEIPYDGSNLYEFFENTYGMDPEDTYYSVNCIYIRDDEQCESEYVDVMVEITDVAENGLGSIKLYPNPTSGTVNVEGTGHLTVMNMLGQTIRELDLNGKISLDLPRGVFFVRNNGATKKLVVE